VHSRGQNFLPTLPGRVNKSLSIRW
jgi:hypothetical protein